MNYSRQIRVKPNNYVRLKKFMHRNELGSLDKAIEYLLDCYEKGHPIYPLDFKSGYEIAIELGLIADDEVKISE